MIYHLDMNDIIVLLSTIAQFVNTIVAIQVTVNHDFVTLSLLLLLVMHAVSVCHCYYYCIMHARDIIIQCVNRPLPTGGQGLCPFWGPHLWLFSNQWCNGWIDGARESTPHPPPPMTPSLVWPDPRACNKSQD